MTPDQPLAVVTDDTPRAATLTARQSTVAIAERDTILLVTAVAAVLNSNKTKPLAPDDHTRLRRLNKALFRALSASGQREVRERTVRAAPTLQRSA